MRILSRLQLVSCFSWPTKYQVLEFIYIGTCNLYPLEIIVHCLLKDTRSVLRAGLCGAFFCEHSTLSTLHLGPISLQVRLINTHFLRIYWQERRFVKKESVRGMWTTCQSWDLTCVACRRVEYVCVYVFYALIFLFFEETCSFDRTDWWESCKRTLCIKTLSHYTAVFGLLASNASWKLAAAQQRAGERPVFVKY